MRISDRNWMQVEEYLVRDDRIVLPVGSTEQHAYLSLATDSVLAERIAVEAAEPLGVLVLPAMPFGIAPGFAAFHIGLALPPETPPEAAPPPGVAADEPEEPAEDAPSPETEERPE